MESKDDIDRIYDFHKHINTTALVVFAGVLALGPVDSVPISKLLGAALFWLILAAIFSMFALRNIARDGEIGSITVFRWKQKRKKLPIKGIPFLALMMALVIIAFSLSTYGYWLHLLWSF